MGWWERPRSVSVCVDTPGWFDTFAGELVRQAAAKGDCARLARNPVDIQSGGVAFWLSCMKLTPPEILSRNHHNIVVHASALPEGRGFSPLVWQVLEGKNEIPISMIFAAEEADAGEVILRDTLNLSGHELNGEMRDALGLKIVDMCLAYLDLPEPPVGEPQTGVASWYPRRRAKDSELNPDRTIAEQFDLLRVVDNERYPAFFEYRGHRYKLTIEEM